MLASAAKNCSRNLLGPIDSLYLPELICPASNHKCKPYPTIKPYTCKPQKQKDLNALRESAKAPQTMCKNLTLSDWLNVVDYHDIHQLISQNEQGVGTALAGAAVETLWTHSKIGLSFLQAVHS